MHTCQITVERLTDAGDEWPVVVERRRPDDLVERRVDGVLRLAKDELEDLQSMALLPQRYGEKLGAALFDGPVGIAFAQAREASEDRLRVLLVVEAPDLRHLRWERVFAPFDGGATWDFLALRQQAPLSLYVPSVADRRFPPIGRDDLRALVLAASPPGLGRDLPRSTSARQSAVSGRPSGRSCAMCWQRARTGRRRTGRTGRTGRRHSRNWPHG
jgi:hypothetical protein